jgi:hypothetical protein
MIAMKQRVKFFGSVAACALCSITLLCAVSWSQAVKPREYDDSEGYAVLSVLLAQRFSAASNDTLIISPVTSSGSMADSFESCRQIIPDEFQSAARDFKDKNKQKWRLVKKFNLKFEYEFEDQVKKAAPPTPVPGEQEMSPLTDSTVFVVSAVGFDATRTHAIAYVAGFCGVQCAGGAYHLLVKAKDGWKSVQNSPVCKWMADNSIGLHSWRSL